MRKQVRKELILITQQRIVTQLSRNFNIIKRWKRRLNWERKQRYKNTQSFSLNKAITGSFIHTYFACIIFRINRIVPFKKSQIRKKMAQIIKLCSSGFLGSKNAECIRFYTKYSLGFRVCPYKLKSNEQYPEECTVLFL